MIPRTRPSPSKGSSEPKPSNEPKASQSTSQSPQLTNIPKRIIPWSTIFDKERIEESQSESSSGTPEGGKTNHMEKWLKDLAKTPELALSLKDSFPEGPYKEAIKALCKAQAETKTVSNLPKTKPLESQSVLSSSKEIAIKEPSLALSKLPVNPTLNHPSKFFLKSSYQSIITIEDGFYHPNPHIAAETLFSKWMYKPWDLRKDPAFYQKILIETGSVKIKHFPENNPTPDYSTCTIFKVLSPIDWGKDLSSERSFKVNYHLTQPSVLSYTYWDYHQAWMNAFFIQNKALSHTWLFFFNTSSKFSFPRWFAQWWAWMGITPELLPPPVESGFAIFRKNYQPKNTEVCFEECHDPLLLFASKFFVPWVLSWYFEYKEDYYTKSPMLVRRFKVKWWSKFQKAEQSSKEAVLEWLSAQAKNKGKKIEAGPTSPSSNLFLARKAHASSALAAAKTEDEYFAIMKQILSSQSASSSTASEDITDLANENEDDCFGVFTPIKK